MARLLDWLFPFRRAMMDVRFNDRGVLWLALLWHIFGWGILYAILQSI